VPDDIVIDVVKKKITACEKECRHWIIEGFPRTKV
jgi:adenylate kinase family enzyme